MVLLILTKYAYLAQPWNVVHQTLTVVSNINFRGYFVKTFIVPRNVATLGTPDDKVQSTFAFDISYVSHATSQP